MRVDPTVESPSGILRVDALEVMMPPPAEMPAGTACADAYASIRAALDSLDAEQLPALALVEAALDALSPEAKRAQSLALLGQCRSGLVEAVHATANADAHGAQKALEQVRALLGCAPSRRTRFGLADILGALAPTPWVCKGLDWCPGRPPMIIGYPGSGKTLAVQAAALALITGRAVWGCPDFRPQRPMRVLHVDFDQGRGATFKRYQRLMAGMELSALDLQHARDDLASILDCAPEALGDMLVVDDSPPELRLMSLDATAAFESAWHQRVQGFDVVIVDSLRKLAPVLDENDSRFGEIPEVLRRVSDATGCTFLLLHHTARLKPADKRPAAQAGRGSGAIDGAAGAQLVIEVENPEDPAHLRRRRVVHARASADAEGGTLEPFYIAFRDGDPAVDLRPVSVEYRTEEQVNGPGERPSDKLGKVKTEILTFLRRETATRRPVAGKEALAAVLGLDARLVRAAVDQLEADGLVVNRPEKNGPGPAKPRLWANLSAPPTPEVEEERCSRCRGTGTIAEYAHKDGGKCFACNGTGKRRGKGARAEVPTAVPMAHAHAHVPDLDEADHEDPMPAARDVEPEIDREDDPVAPEAPAARAPKPAAVAPRPDPLAAEKQAILSLVREHPGAPGRVWVREQLRHLALRAAAFDAAWFELVRHGKIKDRGTRGAPAFHVADETRQRPSDTPPTDAAPASQPPPSGRPVNPRYAEEVEPADASSTSAAANARPPDATGHLSKFLAERCELDPDARITRAEILAAYVAWVGARDVEVDERRLATVLIEQLPGHGIEVIRSVRHSAKGVPGRGWRGVRLREAGRKPPAA